LPLNEEHTTCKEPRQREKILHRANKGNELTAWCQ